jgi:hypothetical protein
MQRLFLRVVLCVFIYTTSVWILGRTADALAYLLSKVGSPELWVALHQYPFGRAIVTGFLAGLIPLEVWLSVSGFFSADIPEFLKKLDLEPMKTWVVAIYSPILIMALFSWLIDWYTMHSQGVTVLQEGSSVPPISTIFEGFFSTSCRDVSDSRLSLWSDNFLFHCTIHIQLISIFLMAAGYSLAPIIRAHLRPTQMTEEEEPLAGTADEIDSESKMAESTEKQ